jgi:hypothetical protein
VLQSRSNFVVGSPGRPTIPGFEPGFIFPVLAQGITLCKCCLHGRNLCPWVLILKENIATKKEVDSMVKQK